MRDLLGGALGSLRYEPTEKRLRMSLDGELVGDTVDGLLVWEPRRLVPPMRCRRPTSRRGWNPWAGSTTSVRPPGAGADESLCRA